MALAEIFCMIFRHFRYYLNNSEVFEIVGGQNSSTKIREIRTVSHGASTTLYVMVSGRVYTGAEIELRLYAEIHGY